MKRDQWRELGDRNWVRKRWRSAAGGDDHCAVCNTPLNRPDTYYVRPAYTDGQMWICSSCFDQMTRQLGDEIDHRYGRRP